MSFELGQLVMTQGINDRVAEDDQFALQVMSFLRRYMRMDWGDICDEDKQSNDLAVQHGDDRILAGYQVPDESTRVWIITEWDHSATTILLPEEY